MSRFIRRQWFGCAWLLWRWHDAFRETTHTHANKLRFIPGIRVHEMNINFYANTNITWETRVGVLWSHRNLAQSMTLQICTVARVREPTGTHARTLEHNSFRSNWLYFTLQKYTPLKYKLNLIHAVTFPPDRWTLLSCVISYLILKTYKSGSTGSRIFCVLLLLFYYQSQLL